MNKYLTHFAILCDLPGRGVVWDVPYGAKVRDVPQGVTVKFPRPEGEHGELHLHYKDGTAIRFSDAAAQTISDVLKAYAPEHGMRKRVEQFQFCIDRVAEALGNVCCGGVDSSPEDQMSDPHSTTRVLVDAIAKLQKVNALQAAALDVWRSGKANKPAVSLDEADFIASLKNRDGL